MAGVAALGVVLAAPPFAGHEHPPRGGPHGPGPRRPPTARRASSGTRTAEAASTSSASTATPRPCAARSRSTRSPSSTRPRQRPGRPHPRGRQGQRRPSRSTSRGPRTARPPTASPRARPARVPTRARCSASWPTPHAVLRERPQHRVPQRASAGSFTADHLTGEDAGARPGLLLRAGPRVGTASTSVFAKSGHLARSGAYSVLTGRGCPEPGSAPDFADPGCRCLSRVAAP